MLTRALAGQLDAAPADCNEAVRLDRQSAHALDSRGLVHFKLNRLAEASADCDAPLQIDPKYAHALYGRGV